MPRLYILFTALLPPPPTPITLMIDLWCVGKSNLYVLSTIFKLTSIVIIVINQQSLGLIQYLSEKVYALLFFLHVLLR